MIRIMIQLKAILRDKISLLSFSLPIIIAFIMIFLNRVQIDTLDTLAVGIVDGELEVTIVEQIHQISHVYTYNSRQELVEDINNPSTEIIGVIFNNAEIEVLISGDETQKTKAITSNLLSIISGTTSKNIAVEKRTGINPLEVFKYLIYAIIILMSLFIGCTFNAMNITNEKEDGISIVYQILPFSTQVYMYEKIAIGYIASTAISIITVIILIRDFKITILLLPIIFLAAYIVSMFGLLMGMLSSSYVMVISNIKLLMSFFLAVPIVEYAFSNNETLKLLANLVPSIPVFYGILHILENDYLGAIQSIIILLAHCIVIFIIYTLSFRRKVH